MNMLQPMLAPQKIQSIDKLVKLMPLCISEKMDGIRCLIASDMYTRTGKAVPNVYIKERLQNVIDFCRRTGIVLDGELWFRDRGFQAIQSDVMTRSKQDIQINYCVFDLLTAGEWYGDKEVQPFLTRARRLPELVKNVCNPYLKIVPQKVIYNKESLEREFEGVLSEGGEGLMLRSLEGGYKHGRCTFRENIIHKLKSYDEEDVTITAYEPYEVNVADRVTDEFGYSKTTGHKGDKQAIEALGTLVVQLDDGRTCRVGTGFTMEERGRLWKRKGELIGKRITISFTEVGVKESPRFPSFQGFANVEDRLSFGSSDE